MIIKGLGLFCSIFFCSLFCYIQHWDSSSHLLPWQRFGSERYQGCDDSVWRGDKPRPDSSQAQDIPMGDAVDGVSHPA